MARGAVQFFSNDIENFIEREIDKDPRLSAQNRRVIEAFEKYGEALSRLPANRHFAAGEKGLGNIIAESLCYSKSPDEILDMAWNDYHVIQEKLRALAGKIDGTKPWGLIIHEGRPGCLSQDEFIRMYRKEVQKLRRFIYSKKIISIPSHETVIVLQTPPYLKSLRATASYRSPLTGRTQGAGIFYITPKFLRFSSYYL